MIWLGLLGPTLTLTRSKVRCSRTTCSVPPASAASAIIDAAVLCSSSMHGGIEWISPKMTSRAAAKARASATPAGWPKLAARRLTIAAS